MSKAQRSEKRREDGTARIYILKNETTQRGIPDRKGLGKLV
eukprot:CAMPEP_0201130052 /NCGR_PEP_ID=MMETSP0850-20130426/38712_1 /ASSEMBLY_ACC=CAM_ASM_000622 /TAXON_ID=183588 /ORGANISM="Pseudo-nitzschia fraudulenta, Strain WWA7" /LENGTH=40 /DNA_ID= /DNA_START= /DNA_END= /DNA_ORIENTATION=